MFFPEDVKKPKSQKQERAPDLYICRCPQCQCHCRTAYHSKVCYSCRGGEGVAHFAQVPAHRPEPRKRYTKDEPVHG